MKAQGLPMSFIIIAVMSVLVLVVVAIFFYSGFRTEAVTQQTAVNACDSRCLTEVRTSPTYPSNTTFCAITQDVKGLGEDLRCDYITTCKIEKLDCTLSCSGTTTSCP